MLEQAACISNVLRQVRRTTECNDNNVSKNGSLTSQDEKRKLQVEASSHFTHRNSGKDERASVK